MLEAEALEQGQCRFDLSLGCQGGLGGGHY